MDIDPALNSLLAQLGAHVGLGSLKLDEEGTAALRIGESLVVNFQAVSDDDTLMLYVDLGPTDGGEAFYESLLKANLFWRVTCGATLSLTENSPPHVVLAREYHWRTLDLSGLVTRLEEFIATAQDWTELVQQPAEDSGEDNQARKAGSEDTGMIRV